jgi:beta-N-acetylhexosaminidase
VMTSHLVVTAWDADAPTTLSRAVIGRLRADLDFTGVVVSDALDMAGASAGRGIPDAAVQALDAGCDLLCLGPTTGSDDGDVALVGAVVAAVVAAVGEGRLAEDRLADAAARVAALPRPVPLPPGPVDPGLLRSGAARSLTVEGALPSLAGAAVVRIDSPATIAVGEVPWGLPVDAPYDDLPADRPLVVQVRDAHRQPEVVAALRRVADRPAVVVEWGWPGPAVVDLPRICARGWSRPGRDAVADVLRAEGWDG